MTERNIMDRRELAELGAVGSVGAAGVTMPRLDQFADFFTGITPIASFFLILIPTGIWAWVRAVQYIKETIRKDN
jgi:hypothetical protein